MRGILTTIGLAALGTSVAWGADAAAGKPVYDTKCKSCHGADGTPNASVAKMMKVEMRDLKSPDVQSMSEADLKKLITGGKGKMKPVKTVSAADLDHVVAYVKRLK